VTRVSETVGFCNALELKQRLDQGDYLTVLDVREDDERAYASIPVPASLVDLHVPLGEVRDRLEEIRAAAEGRLLVVYCHHGQRSMVAATWLARQGLGDLMNLEGGIDAWSTGVDSKVGRY
jgi:rhodanese-related sulfurtransferase